jgi:ribosomal protein L11 methylase PrmA
MNPLHADSGSFRDPSGRVYSNGYDIYRIVSAIAAAEYNHIREIGLLSSLIEEGYLIETEEVDRRILGPLAYESSLVLRHARIPFVSYPYEWSFPLLKAAAMLYLNIQIKALSAGVTLSDATAYNVQFRGTKPVFIDVLSFRRYQDGEVWDAHRQFCEQFLNPLLLRSLFGIPHNAWFRGNLEGIETSYLAPLIPWWRNLSFNIFSYVTLQAKLQKKATMDSGKMVVAAKMMKLPKPKFERLLFSLRDWVATLQPKDTGLTVWQQYPEKTTYSLKEYETKCRFVSDFCAKLKPETLWDIGCNTGEYSQIALSSGVNRVIGFDFDQGALEDAYARSKENALDFLPLYQDSANPSPQQGWANVERGSIQSRGGADSMIALAIVHHLAISRNIPLEMIVDWLIQIAPYGIIEFVQKDDPMVRELLTLRRDVFLDYSKENFEAAIKARAQIVRSETVSATGRTLYLYDRSTNLA